MAKRRKRYILDSYTIQEHILKVERIQDGILLPQEWVRLRRWLRHMPMSKLKSRVNRGEYMYYVPKFGYRRNGDVYEVDERCVGAICMVLILVSGGVPLSVVSDRTGLTPGRIDSILRNYKYYVGWHNAYTMDGRRIWPAIREVELLHRDGVI